MKSNLLKTSFIVGIILIVSFGCQQKNELKTFQKPNILFIAVDDLRPQLNSYSVSQVISPSIDKLASESIVFNKAYCNVPVCSASRASLLSGLRPTRYRFLDWKTYLQKDVPDVLSLPMHFRNNGYNTISNGKIYHHMDDDANAWNEIWHPNILENVSWRDYQTPNNLNLDTGSHSGGLAYEKIEGNDSIYFDGKTTLKSVKDLKKLTKDDKPFFLAVGFRKPHLPFNAPAKYWDLYKRDSFILPDNYIQPVSTPKEAFHRFDELRDYDGVPQDRFLNAEEAKTLIHGYNACVSYIDAQIGELLKTLDELKISDNTIIVLWGDHGWNLGDHKMWTKHCNFETALRVPLIVKAPGKTSGETTEAITELIDIYPSLCELAGIELPTHLDGKSFVPVINGEKEVKNYAISKYHDGITLIKDDIFYTEWLNDEGVVRSKMMFDQKLDPLELNNIVNDPKNEKKVNELSEFLHNNWGDSFFDKNQPE
jgi:choline-sulfatase